MAEVFAPKEKKSFLTIKGEWNGEMYAKFDDSTVSWNPKAKNTKLEICKLALFPFINICVTLHQHQPLGLLELSEAAVS